MRLLLQDGAEVDVLDNDGFTPLHEEPDMRVNDKDRKLLSHVGSPVASVGEVQTLLDAGADANIKDPESGVTPLLIAINKLNAEDLWNFYYRCAEEEDSDQRLDYVLRKADKRREQWLPIIKLLVANEAEINVADSDGQTALWLILGPRCQVDCFDVLSDTLIRAGANADIAPSASTWLQRWAQASGNLSDAYGGEREIETRVDTVIAAGTDINRQDKQGRTPLMNAIINNHPEIMIPLLAWDADLEIRDHSGRNAQDWASIADRGDIRHKLDGLTSPAQEEPIIKERNNEELHAMLPKEAWYMLCSRVSANEIRRATGNYHLEADGTLGNIIGAVMTLELALAELPATIEQRCYGSRKTALGAAITMTESILLRYSRHVSLGNVDSYVARWRHELYGLQEEQPGDTAASKGDRTLSWNSLEQGDDTIELQNADRQPHRHRTAAKVGAVESSQLAGVLLGVATILVVTGFVAILIFLG